MDTGTNATTAETITTTTTVPPKVLTPDLIFAEFESDGKMHKSIRKLLEKEKIVPKSTSMSPIYVPEEQDEGSRVVNYGLPVKVDNEKNERQENTSRNTKSTFDRDFYNKPQVPIYIPPRTLPSTTTISSTTSTTTTTESPVSVENIWHIIDNEKTKQQSNDWKELSFDANYKDEENVPINDNDKYKNDEDDRDDKDQEDEDIDDNFALPGFATNSGNGAENESRAIRTEQNIKFPYINLKPFQMKSKNSKGSNKKKPNTYTSLDQITDLKNPVRGEVQDTGYNGQQIDRYNPAQPYLPHNEYGSKVSKQSSPVAVPTRTTSNLVPPPPPPPKVYGDNFPSPVSYESFPPYAPSSPDFAPAPAPPPQQSPPTAIEQSIDVSPNLDSDSGPPDTSSQMDIGYRYKPPTDSDSPMINMGYEYSPPAPAPPTSHFIPTIPPPKKQFSGYNYNKPAATPVIMPPVDDTPDFKGYHYKKPEPVSDYMPPSYGSQPSFESHDPKPPAHDSDYPELIFNKPHGDTNMHDDGMGMMPPPPDTDTKPDSFVPPSDDHGFPHDFPTDFKFHHDVDDHVHDFHFHHDDHTTTTTETPRVNRFSYYYLGKKLYYLPLYFSVYFIVYVGALIIKAVLRHKIVYPNSWRPNTTTATFFTKRSVDEYLSNDNLHNITHRVTRALAEAAEKYMDSKTKTD
ncbi:hypothetical protein KGM_215616 [Danaus plexippus plexippus]|uniref:Uncharacterized protein n=1 Tax=Danaus plexippus plexippus TaxID=278856 RepID=A0A212F1Z7_DANPL|nr:hypothetical protein KGM_215616 [Danaus plexippus plexippus]